MFFHAFRFLFECDEWLLAETPEYRVRRTLSPSSPFTSTVDPSSLVKSNMMHRIVDDHMWLSVGMRTKPSTFTRAQRLGACMATLFLAMISNCMFFKTASEQGPATQAISLGIVTLTPQQISNSIFTSLIIFPPVIFISMLFMKSKRKADGGPDSRFVTDANEQHETHKPKFKLPHWCVYVAWFLIVLAIVASAFFTILYSFQWGKVKSTAWLKSFLLSFLESVIVVQPLKVSWFHFFAYLWHQSIF